MYGAGAVSSPEEIFTERLRLTCLSDEVLLAIANGDRAAVATLMAVYIAPECELSADVAQLRLAQLAEDPGLRPWLLRAVIRSEDASFVGHIGFHSAPDPDYLHEIAPGSVELGYTICAPHRRKGYALEAATGLMDWATNTHGVTDIIVSISPQNDASLGLLHKLAGSYRIETVGNHVDPEDGPEDIFRLRSISG